MNGFQLPTKIEGATSYKLNFRRNIIQEEMITAAFTRTIITEVSVNMSHYYLIKLIEKYYCNEFIYIIVDGDAFSKYYLFSWLIKVDDLYQ